MPEFSAIPRLPISTSAPANSAAGYINLHARDIASRGMLAYIGQSGAAQELQSLLGMKKVALWSPPGNVTTVPGVFGIAAAAASGTATARLVATTSLATRMRRLGYVSATTAGSLAGVRFADAQYTMGTASAPTLGGFFFQARFVISDAAAVSGARAFVGMSSTTAAPTNVEPSTLTNSIGLGVLSTSNNLHLVYGGTAAQTAIDLGANFPGNTLSADAYELTLFAPPGINNTAGYRVVRLNTGDVATGTLTAATPGTQLPGSTTLLAPRAWRGNNATALAVGIDIVSIYLETDY